MTTILITGANRGLGLGMARHAAAKGYTVIGTARDPDQANELRAVTDHVEQLDTGDAASIEALGDRLSDQPIDILVNNAGIFPHPSDDIRELDTGALERVIRVNTFGPILTTRAFIEQLARSERRLNVSISSNLGSINDATTNGGGYLGYRVSKAALNMGNAVIAHQLKEKGITSVVIHPGWVQTDMGGPQAPLLPDESTGSIIETIDRLTAADNGRFIDYAGRPLQW
jgi:NAD(P)-dependent dehydrogenase (short-subunit alcohol dehydrogenase family)